MGAIFAFKRRGCAPGLAYRGIQKASHTNPIAPVRIKAHCQPQLIAIQGTVSGATMAPTFEPALKMPVAKARSFLGNHSAVVLIAAGKFPDSPTPRAARATPKPKADRARAWLMAAMLQIIKAAE